MKKGVRINANSSLFRERPDLLNEAASGVRDVLIIQGHDPVLSSGGLETSRVLDAAIGRYFDDRRQQVDAGALALDLVNNTKVGDGGQDYIMLDKDMYAPETNFVFGVTYGGSTQLAIQSISRFVRSVRDSTMQGKLIRHVARHEYAHMAGLMDSSDFTNPDRRGGIYDGHCADLCTMQQVASVNEAVSQVRRLDGHELAGFCLNCVDTLDSKA